MSGWWICESCKCPVPDGNEKRKTDEDGIERIYCEDCNEKEESG